MVATHALVVPSFNTGYMIIGPSFEIIDPVVDTTDCGQK
jgi:hypothetical protein